VIEMTDEKKSKKRSERDKRNNFRNSEKGRSFSIAKNPQISKSDVGLKLGF
jgi:hypothetical protein